MVLISTPWPLFNRPSIQLGTLKAYLNIQFPELKVHAHHFYLNLAAHIGYPVYQQISEKTWLSETVYAALLFPENLPHIEKLFRKEAKKSSRLREIDFKTMVKQVKEISNSFIRGIHWEEFSLAGFSICLCQLTSSLYFIKEIKKRFSDLPVVIGGSMFSGNSSKELLKTFPEIDFVVNGEGELPLTQLVRFLKDSIDAKNIAKIQGIVCSEIPLDAEPSFFQMENLNDLPPPDYDDYFNLLSSLNYDKFFFPTLPLEMSRGCWWANRKNQHKFTGCAFCNLNLQWNGYRSKSPSQVLAEVNALTENHQLLSLSMMDNVSPIKSSQEIFSRIRDLDKDFRFFCEIRANMPLPVLKTMKQAGVYELQIGIESLSTRLLNKMNKGTTAIQNLEIMKHCETLNIINNSNLILHFPGSEEQDVAETLRVIEFAMVFRPLRCVHFWLGLESVVWRNSKDFGIKAVFNHQNYSILFPKKVSRAMTFIVQAYRGDIEYQRQLWSLVEKKVAAWNECYEKLHQDNMNCPILSFRDGGKFMLIQQKQLNEKPMIHRLVGTSRKIYLFCQIHRSIKRILKEFPGLSEEKLLSFLRMMKDKKLMFEESEKYLSLASPVRY